MAAKSAEAFRTIGELAGELGVPQHILRYWETRFPQLRPLQRAGNRRYYRADDVALARRIHRLLSEEGYTIRGVQRVLEGKVEAAPAAPRGANALNAAGGSDLSRELLERVRQLLVDGLEDGNE